MLIFEENFRRHLIYKLILKMCNYICNVLLHVLYFNIITSVSLKTIIYTAKLTKS